MTQYERMLAGLIYDPADPQILTEQAGFAKRLWAFNQLRPGDTAEKERYMREVFASCGGGCQIELPFAPTGAGTMSTSAITSMPTSTSPLWTTAISSWAAAFCSVPTSRSPRQTTP